MILYQFVLPHFYYLVLVVGGCLAQRLHVFPKKTVILLVRLQGMMAQPEPDGILVEYGVYFMQMDKWGV